MAKHYLAAQYDGGKHRVEVEVELYTWEAEGMHYEYAPALDMTGYGKSGNEASKSFQHNLAEFISYTMNKNTIYEELERLGWTVNKKKKRVVAPHESELMADNDTYRDILGMQGVQRHQTNLELAL